MKYWICIDSDNTQGIGVGDTVQSEEEPDSNWGSFEWKEITEDQYAKVWRKKGYRVKLLSELTYRGNFAVLSKNEQWKKSK